MWYWYHIHFRILCIHQVAITDCRKLKIEFGVAYICIPFILNFVQISHFVKNLEKVPARGEHDLLNLLVVY